MLIDIANRLGHSALAGALAAAFEDTSRQVIPSELKRDLRHTAIELVMPRSCTLRPERPIEECEKLETVDGSALAIRLT
jgi:hypothetical protein